MKVAYLTNVLPAYRSGFFRRLLSDTRLEVTVFCHEDVHGHDVTLIPEELRHRVKFCTSHSLFGGAIVFEHLPFRTILSEYDVVISDGNPRHLGFALLSSLAALMRRRVIVWSTLHSRRNRPLTQSLRLAWWRIFPEFLSYTEPDAANLRSRFRGRIARSTNNGLDQNAIDDASRRYSAAELQAFKSKLGLEGRQIGLSIGRALPGRFDLMAKVIRQLKDQDSDFHWILLGDGSGIAELRAALESHGVSDRAILAGAVHDEAELAKWFGIADLFVYPDAIGLSLYHAFGYGLPAVVHDRIELHGPEMGAFEEGRTGATFRMNDAGDMARHIQRLLADPKAKAEMGRYARRIVRERYNADIMYARFARALLEPATQF